MIDKTFKFDVRVGLEHYFPSLSNLIVGDIRWTSLNKIFNQRFEAECKRWERGETFEKRISIFDVSVSAVNGNDEHKELRLFIDNVFKSLSLLLTLQEKQKIKKNIANLLQYDHEFLNYFGELCVLNCLMKGNLYRLVNTEYKKNKNGKGIDFHLQEIDTSNNIFVEVVNIELRADKLIDFDTTRKFLSRKLTAKLVDTDKSGMTDYHLIPVVWGGKEDLENINKLKNFIEQTDFKLDRVTDPMVYQILEKGGNSFSKFDFIRTCQIIG